MPSISRWSICFGGALLIAGCASVDPRRDYERASMHANVALGQQLRISPDDRQQVQLLVAERLNGGLTADEAVQIALLNNPKILEAIPQPDICGVRTMLHADIHG